MKIVQEEWLGVKTKNSFMNNGGLIKGEILVVDDDPVSLELLFEMLQAQNYDVRVATSGPLALAMIKHSPPDLILLDINMANMSGYEVCRKLKADPNYQDLPIIFISAND